MDSFGRDDAARTGVDDAARTGVDDGLAAGFDDRLAAGFDDGLVATPVLPGYRSERLLGTGASAQVWLVQHEGTGELLAAKCFPPVVADVEAAGVAATGVEAGSVEAGGVEAADAGATGAGGNAGGAAVAGVAGPGVAGPLNAAPGLCSGPALLRELRILGNFSHEHLLTARGVVGLSGSWRGGRALLMDYAPGGSLAGLVAIRGRISVGEAVTVLTPLAQVLGYLHGEGVAHGDVSPGNVLFSAQGKPMLADFGVARMVGEAGRPQFGTPGFFAAARRDPESRRPGGTAEFDDPLRDGPLRGDPLSDQLHGDPLHGDPLHGDLLRGDADLALDTTGDVYAAAAVGWYALTGQVPGDTDSRPPLSAFVPGVPEELAAALEAGLQEAPSRRPTAMEFAQAVYRSAPAAPIDLSSAVHPSVLPDLLTRRKVRAPRARWYKPGDWLSRPFAAGPHLPSTRQDGRGIDRARDRSHRHRDLRGGNHPRRNSRAVAVAAGGRHHLRSRTVRGIRAVAAALVLLLLAAACMLMWGTMPAGPLAPADVDTEAVPPHDALLSLAVPDSIRIRLASNAPSEALGALAWLRSYAFSSGQPNMLQFVNVSGSPAAAADGDVAAALEQKGHVLSGLESQVLNVTELADELPDSAELNATTVTSGFAEQDGQGVVVRTQPDAVTQQLLFVLHREQGRWRIAEVHQPRP
ncbi:serine/threonine protein kinase [Arthrobacter sp. H14-L1]|uniref:serine/threonine protein kinase n=1 Tax=Arthrobacter sp. H14-L1 TaxID=2996697 RepID=UPI002271647D|nr:protein kinase [Arthrobacter sp. H14-L1]MCY0904271.1 protein kinase [Arthrobacter sp. H14-L1]